MYKDQQQVHTPAACSHRAVQTRSQDRNYGKMGRIFTSRLCPLKREVAGRSGRSVEGGSGLTHVLTGHPAGHQALGWPCTAPGGSTSLGWRPGRSHGQSELARCAPCSRPLMAGSVLWVPTLLSLDKRKGCGPLSPA